MTSKIQVLGSKVSNHMVDYRKLNVLDIDPYSIDKNGTVSYVSEFINGFT